MRAIGCLGALLMCVGCGGNGDTQIAKDAGAQLPNGDGGTARKDSGTTIEAGPDLPGADSSTMEPDSSLPAADAARPSPCTADTCQNGGSCSTDDAGATCVCAAGFEGDTCEQEIDECTSAGCVHATGCTDGVNDFTCACEAGWNGKTCDQDVDECLTDPCEHATACENQAGTYTCSCESGWFGKNCDVFCDDSKAATTDTLHPLYGCAHRTQNWTTFDSGIYADHVTGLGWWQNPGPIGYDNLKQICADLDKAGVSDWRLPTINEARSLGGDCAPTASGGSCTISDPSCLDQACGYGVAGECNSCIGGSGGSATHPSGGYCRPDVTLCNNWWTSSLCADCMTDQVWFYGVTNGNFYHDAPTGGRSGACVAPLPDL